MPRAQEGAAWALWCPPLHCMCHMMCLFRISTSSAALSQPTFHNRPPAADNRHLHMLLLLPCQSLSRRVPVIVLHCSRISRHSYRSICLRHCPKPLASCRCSGMQRSQRNFVQETLLLRAMQIRGAQPGQGGYDVRLLRALGGGGLAVSCDMMTCAWLVGSNLFALYEQQRLHGREFIFQMIVFLFYCK